MMLRVSGDHKLSNVIDIDESVGYLSSQFISYSSAAVSYSLFLEGVGTAVSSVSICIRSG